MINGRLPLLKKQDDLYLCRVEGNVWDLFEQCGHVPLPPYIQRPDEHSDLSRYQTIYANPQGSVAAPTAGLHFDEALFAKLKARGVNVAYVTLHVGAGTFRPVRTESILDHQMHLEFWT